MTVQLHGKRTRLLTRASCQLLFVLMFCSLLFPFAPEAQALNKTVNWDFNGNATGWTPVNGVAEGTGSGNPACGATTDAITLTMSTFAYNGNLGGETAFQATTPAVKNKDYRGNISQIFIAPGSGTVSAKGKFSVYGNSNNWGSGKVSVQVWDATNTTFVAEIGCVLMSTNTSWTATGFGSDFALTGGTTYTLRANLVAKTKSNSNTAVTVGVDNIVLNIAPTGLAATAPASSINGQLDWTVSTAGSGADGLHATTPYKVYRDTSSPVSTFLANSSTNSYTDTSTTGNTTYYYAVSDVDTAGYESPLSAESSVLTRPGAPGTPSFTSVTETTLTVNFTAPTGGSATYDVERCTGAACSSGWTTVSSGQEGLTFADSGLTAATVYGYRIVGNNASGAGVYSATGYQETGAAGTLSVDIVDSGGTPVSSPSVTMGPITFDFLYQTPTGAFGISEERIRVTNSTGNAQWTLTLAATGGSTDLWDGGTPQYDFNDPTGSAADGADADSYGGQMTIDASASTLGGTCSATGITKGGSTAFSEGVTDSVTLLTAGATADTGCYWDLTDVSVSQTIPPEQVAGSYSIDVTLTITAI